MHPRIIKPIVIKKRKDTNRKEEKQSHSIIHDPSVATNHDGPSGTGTGTGSLVIIRSPVLLRVHVVHDEPAHDADELVGALRPGVHHEEAVVGAGDLHVLHLLAPLLLHPPRVLRVPVPQHVAPAGHHQHGGHLHGLQPGRPRPRRAEHRVVPAGALGQRQPRVPVAHLGGEERVARALQLLRARAGVAGHGRRQEERAADPDAGSQAGPAEPDRDVVGDVAARRVARHEDAREVGRVGEPGVAAAGGGGAQPGHGPGAVLLGGREPVLGRQAVVEGEHHGGELGAQAEAPGVEVGPPPGPDAEAAAVEVGHHGDPRVVGRAQVPRPVQARVQAVRRVPRHVLPLHAALVFRDVHRREQRRRLRAAPHRAVAHQLQHAAAVLHHVRLRLRRRRRHSWLSGTGNSSLV
uniref:Uncharacterized protein n=1 Tax=Zea mays TaxID=4577 RepID=C0PKW6_MAIZE|nr:unknown [Zea mays]